MTTHLEKQLEKITVKEGVAPRPGIGNLGQKVKLRANHLKISKFPNLKLYLYNYNVTSSSGRTIGKKVRWKVFEEIKKQKKFGKSLPIFNWNDMIYSSTKLFLEQDEFELPLPPSEPAGKITTFKIKIKFKEEFSLQHIKDFMESKQAWNKNVQTCMNALNAYLNYKVRTNYVSLGRGIYASNNNRVILSGGAELRQGHCQSLRVGWNDLTVNVDVCSGIFCPPGNVVDIAAGILNRRKDDLRRGIDDRDRRMLAKALKTLRIRVLHRGDNKRSIYSIDDLSKDSADNIKFRDEEERETSVTQFFAKKYGMRLAFGSLPCIKVSKNCFPLEVCEILPDQPFKGDITDNGRADMIKFTCVKPRERFQSIRDAIHNVFRYGQDENLRSINMGVDTEMIVVEGRVLPPVSISFNKDRGQQNQKVDTGRWNFVSQVIQDGKKLTNWSILALSGDHQNAIAQFGRQLTETLNKKGMNIVNQPAVVIFNQHGDIKRGLTQAAERARMNKDEPVQLVLVVMRERSRLYSDIKRIAETELSIRTQCVLNKNIRKPKGFEQFCVNVGLKINAKLGGRNYSLSTGQIDFVSSVPTMIFGADVYHSGVHEQHMPSIASVCASMDAAATIYSGRYSMNKEPRNETIEELDLMVIDLLKAFRAKNGRLPQRILFYRDGVSEGQFRKVMEVEVDMLRKAFKGGYGDNPPKLTFIIVQKRHHTRFEPTNQRDSDRGNCRPGTVVDTGIVVKQEFDFFLQSHASLLGTGRPTHYRVLVDDNKFKADDFQSLTNKLCYLNARCTSSISIVTPAYYAHLICNRARHYTVWQGESSSEGSATCASVSKPLTNLMYFL
ncbi:unnamed protein product [Rhizophagus irregularis]|nr:unnamed protein product [Rhizophagus irregularis]CAB5374959.1 unnamed protein product [Rhizophagus irregularis]